MFTFLIPNIEWNDSLFYEPPTDALIFYANKLVIVCKDLIHNKMKYVKKGNSNLSP